MNQIIYPEKLENTPLTENNHKLKLRYKIMFYASILFLAGFIIYYSILYFNLDKKEQVSKKILSAYDIQTLYSSSSSFSNPCIILENGKSVEILGVIEIKKINLRYPILADFSDELLEIAPCKFYGNTLNKIGNVCIAGHNYDNGEFFSNLCLLELGDVIDIYDLTGAHLSYTIYDMFETVPFDTSCTSQNTSFRDITLITCNNSNNKRLIVKAKNR